VDSLISPLLLTNSMSAHGRQVPWAASPPVLPSARQANQAGFTTATGIWSTGGYNGTALAEHLFRTSVCGTPTPTATATATATCTPSSPIANGGFETGTFAPWVIQDTAPAPVVSNLQAHSGTFSGHVGSLPPGETPGDSSIYQTITVPASGGTLSYWYWPRSVDSITFDWQDAYVTDTSGTILTTIMHVCQNSQVWTNMTFNMAPYAGQTVRIKFLAHGDNAGDPTDMFVDDVTLPGAVCGTPTNTPTNTPTGTPTCTPAGTPGPWRS
jgi:hypothetical protein